jgi:type VI secretion system protein ImpG
MPSISQAVHRETFQLGCTPIVNLFERTAEPVRLTHTTTEYRVVPDRHRQASTEVYSVDKVTSTAQYGSEQRAYEPFYSFRHTYGGEEPQCFWYAHRRPTMRNDYEGTEVFLSLVDLNFQPARPATDVLIVQTTCTNRDLVSRINWKREWGEIEGEGLPMVQARCTVTPTRSERPPLRGGLQWRLISHLALNHLSIVQGGGREALQEILRLYCFAENETARRRIDGITGLSSRSSISRVPFEGGITFLQGLDIELELDEEQFAGSGAYLLAAVLERFFGLYSAINSYTRLTARTRQRSLQRWPARAGDRRLL